jgi:ferredoxin/flavodoxin
MENMINRRMFLQESAVLLSSISMSGGATAYSKESYKPLKTRKVKSAIVLWYSQAGNTERYGRLIENVYKKAGTDVSAGDVRDFKNISFQKYDLVVIGSHVFYYDIPDHVKDWLKKISSIDGTAVASYVTFAGPEGNQHNSACSILELLIKKGGVPVGMDMFKNLATLPNPTWTGPGYLENKHLPDKNTYDSVRSFAAGIIKNVENGVTISVERKVALREYIKIIPFTTISKWKIEKHEIDKSKCIDCGSCISKCPVKAIDLKSHTVNRDRCIVCFGCINNCPADAVDMEMKGEKLYGYNEFLKRNNIIIKEPEELL